MSRYLNEPTYKHGDIARIGVLLVNLGTPEAPTAAAVRRYLCEFLADPRVVEIPRALWLPLLHGVIAPLRAGKSAAKYAKIWTTAGSPLLVHGRRQAQLLTGFLGEHLKAAGLPEDLLRVELAMRYGEPSIARALTALREAGCDRLLALPLYPQYAASTTGSVVDALGAALAKLRHVPALRVAEPYHDDMGYIKALARGIDRYWTKHGRPDRLVMSFHGLPRYTLDRGDPYHCHSRKTARLLAQELGLTDAAYQLTFQSRFGRARWLEPYTAATLVQLARDGVRRVDVVCPGFAADCLETLEEIDIECRGSFLAAGGREFHYIPALNDAPAWIAALGMIAWRELQGWLIAPASAAEREMQSAAAIALGAAR
jgi:protoporphyrin/coproporphyrin ferrochelatase